MGVRWLRAEKLEFEARAAARRALFAAASLLGACSAAEEHPPSAGPSTVSTAAASGDSSGRALILGSTGQGGVGNDAGASCAAVAEEAKSTFRPIDVIFVIDNSSSMDDEIAEVQARINGDFADIIGRSGLDYRVIMISRYGKVGSRVGESDNPICIAAPLGSSDCREPSQTKLTNSARFFHYSADVESHDAWCVLLGAFAAADEYGDAARPGWVPLAPQGYSQYLRADAFKAFVVISDDDVSCTSGGNRFDDGVSVGAGEKAAASFDAALLNLSPLQFGSATRRNYVWHSIVGLAGVSPGEAWPASAPVQLSRCEGGSEGPGTGYQALSRLTGGLRYPSCDHESFNAVFNTIAKGIVERAQLTCDFRIPAPPRGQVFDSRWVNVRFRPSARAAGEPILNVPSAASCGVKGGWYYDNPAKPTRVVACPNTCSRIQQSPEGRVDVVFGCRTETEVR